MQRIKLVISYDGTDFCGWQKQLDHKHGPDKPSIQGTLQAALEHIFKHPIVLCASGRTDAGVHAVAQVCHFETDRPMPRDLCWALKAKLPQSIVAKKIWSAPPEFHATLSAEKKIYKYWVWNHSRGTALLNRYSWWIRFPLELDALNIMAAEFLGEHDFASFRSMGTEVKHTIRSIYRSQWIRKKSGILEYQVCGNGFMKQMVRNLVGSQIDLAMRRELSPEQKRLEIRRMLEARDRTKSGRAAPPEGLFLSQVFYPPSLDKKCLPI